MNVIEIINKGLRYGAQVDTIEKGAKMQGAQFGREAYEASVHADELTAYLK